MTFDHAYNALAQRVGHLQIGPDKFVHVQVGLAIWCATALIFRLPLRSVGPLAACIVAECGNELLDRYYTHSWNIPDTAGDMLATWFWPTLLFGLLRLEASRGTRKAPWTPASRLPIRRKW